MPAARRVPVEPATEHQPRRLLPQQGCVAGSSSQRDARILAEEDARNIRAMAASGTRRHEPGTMTSGRSMRFAAVRGGQSRICMTAVRLNARTLRCGKAK